MQTGDKATPTVTAVQKVWNSLFRVCCFSFASATELPHIGKSWPRGIVNRVLVGSLFKKAKGNREMEATLFFKILLFYQLLFKRYFWIVNRSISSTWASKRSHWIFNHQKRTRWKGGRVELLYPSWRMMKWRLTLFFCAKLSTPSSTVLLKSVLYNDTIRTDQYTLSFKHYYTKRNI